MNKDNFIHSFVHPIFTSLIGSILFSYLTGLITRCAGVSSIIIFRVLVILAFLMSFFIFLRIYRYYQNKIPQRIRAIVFDFDGTLTQNNSTRSSWEKIWILLGYKVQDCQKLYDRYKAKEIDHQRWCDLTCTAFKKKKLTRETLTKIAQEIQLMDGVKEVLAKLKNNHNLKLFIVSGSIIQLIEIIIGDDIEDYFDGYKANSFIFHPNNTLLTIHGTKYDFEGKAEYIKKIVQEEGLKSASEILFIGNSDNDEYAYKSGAQTLCFNPKQTDGKNKKIWHKTFKADSYHDLYEFIKQNYILE